MPVRTVSPRPSPGLSPGLSRSPSHGSPPGPSPRPAPARPRSAAGLVLAAAFLVLALTFAAPAAAHAAGIQPAAPSGVYWTPGRIWAVVGATLGLAGVVTGWLALARSATTRRAVTALVSGLAGTAIGGGVVAAAEGGPGTGYGIVGGYIALVVGVAAMALGGLAFARSRRGTASRGT